MARCLFGTCVSRSKFGQILKCSTSAGIPSSMRGCSIRSGVQVHFFGTVRTPSGPHHRGLTWGCRPSLGQQSKLRTCCVAFENFACVFSTCGSCSRGKDSRDPQLQGRVKDRLVQTGQKIKQTGEKVKERLEDFRANRENILTIPNLLCGTRIVLSPILGYLVVQKSFECALGVFVFAGLTDLLDGFIARNFKNQQSTFGSFLDPLADKFLVFCLVLSLTCSQLLPVPLTMLIIARDACLIGASAYVRYLSLPLPKTWSSYFDVTHATARLSPTLISKYNTFVQLVLVACTLAAPVFHMENHHFLPILWYITATTTVASALSYVFSKNTYYILKDLKDKK